MSRGYLTIAQNSDGIDYIRMAYALALSIKSSQNEVTNFAVCVNSDAIIPRKYELIFDDIITIPWGDDAKDSSWKLENEWKAIHMSPYDETIKLDADMIFTTPIDTWWDILNKKPMWFTSNVKTFRGEKVTSNYYRKAFDANKLPNIYTAFMYFKKDKISFEIFKMVEVITRNWEKFFQIHIKDNRPKEFSTDVAFALAIKILGYEDLVTNNSIDIPSFVHMKSYVQNLPSHYLTEKWIDHIPTYFTNDCNLKVGNFTQFIPFHYHVKEWLTDGIISELENKVKRNEY